MHRDTLHRYQNYLMQVTDLKAAGKQMVTSETLAAHVGVTASRVRQDMMALRTLGRPRSGYTVKDLEALLHAKLDLLTAKPMALVGVGNLGRALAQSDLWSHAGFELVELFDNDPNLVGLIMGSFTIRHVSELTESVRQRGIVAACLTVPTRQAQGVANLLVAAGIQAIWNFALVNLQTPPGVIVENQRLEQGLTTLSYLIGQSRREKAGSAQASEDESDDASEEDE